MHRDFTIRKRAILIVLGLLVAADIGLAFYSWQLRSAPRRSQAYWDAQTIQLKLRKADIERADRIKRELPATIKQFDDFEKSLLPVSTGYSAVSSELDSIAKKAGLQIATLAVKPKEVPNRGLEELTIDATVSGDYGSVVRFVNGLQRSQNLYAIDSLALATDTQNQAGIAPVRVGLHVRTYFRNGI